MVNAVIMMVVFLVGQIKLTVKATGTDSCRNVYYNVSTLNQHNKCCQNSNITAQGKALEELRSEFTVAQGNIQDLQKKVNKLLNEPRSECAIDLHSMGFEDPGFNQGGFRGSISVGKVNQPLRLFPRVPSNATTLRGVFLVTLRKPAENCEVIHSAMFDTYRAESAAVSLDSYLRSIKAGSVVAGICVDECVMHLAAANDTLTGMGIDFRFKESDSLFVRSSAAFIATKGRPQDTMMIQLPRKRGPAKLSYIIQK